MVMIDFPLLQIDFPLWAVIRHGRFAMLSQSCTHKIVCLQNGRATHSHAYSSSPLVRTPRNLHVSPAQKSMQKLWTVESNFIARPGPVAAHTRPSRKPSGKKRKEKCALTNEFQHLYGVQLGDGGWRRSCAQSTAYRRNPQKRFSLLPTCGSYENKRRERSERIFALSLRSIQT